ncbi:MAG: Glu-tRNA(Gln) amidotransferase subunit GatD [Candidatus Diapherotrites archaeon]|nr:Glu-tRNA(Gln) amidotransferase subunit GatD [Candidatus Diapherotrites archaeon]
MDYKTLLKKARAQEGSWVQVQEGMQIFEGLALPSHNPHTLVLKLKNGYDVGIPVKSTLKVKKISEGKKTGKPPLNKLPRNPSLPTIAILTTGGTLASRIDYSSGAVSAALTGAELIGMHPELARYANYECTLVRNMMSEDMNFSDYQDIARAIQKALNAGAKGVIVGHGTDTLHYTAAALSFMLENLSAPVLLVGSQRSSDRGSSDAAINLACAAAFIAQTDFAGVGICMHESSADTACVILPGTKSRKMHTSRRDAFKPINAAPLARVHYPEMRVEYLTKDYTRAFKEARVRLREKFSQKVGLLKCYTNFDYKLLEFFYKNKYKGLVLEGTGLGHAPVNTPENRKAWNALAKLLKKGCIVAMASQCMYGRTHSHVYTNLARLHDAGVVFAEDMVPETAYIKLAWLLGNYKAKEAKELFQKNLRGEISARTLAQENVE